MIMVQALLTAGVPAAEIRTYPLDEHSVYTIRLSQEEPTTCVFPGALKALIGANVSSKTDDHPAVLLSHEPGAEYFSLRALKSGATAALNVVFRGRVYALAFVTGGEPDRAVVFLDESAVGGKTPRPGPDTLRALLERARQYERRAVQYPGMVPAIERAQPGNATPHRGFTATVESVVRFDAEDVLVFQVRLDSQRAGPIYYDPQGIFVRLGREIFPAALTDGSGAIPPKGTVRIHLVVSGAPDGGRANLSVRETYTVIVPTTP
jgi:hypothetical protein